MSEAVVETVFFAAEAEADAEADAEAVVFAAFAGFAVPAATD